MKVTNQALDPWASVRKTVTNCSIATNTANGRYFDYSLIDPSTRGEIHAFNGTSILGCIYYVRFTCRQPNHVSLAWSEIIARGSDWIAARNDQVTSMRVLLKEGCPPFTLHHVGIYSPDDWKRIQALYASGELPEPWFAPPANGKANTPYPINV